MRIHWIQHVPFEGLGRIESWIREKGHFAHRCRIYDGEPLPPPAEVDFLIVMGGPMSVNDEARYEWLRAEKQCIHDVIERGKPVLGICLGAQLVASALGENVYRAPEAEVGWFPVTGCSPREGQSFRFPDDLMVFQWHGETFELPKNAVRLASSSVCPNQAFLIGDRVIGLQFHLETTLASAKSLIENCPEDLEGGGPFVQTAELVLEKTPEHPLQAESEMNRVLNFLAAAGE